MILMNAAYVPYFFNNDKIIAIHHEMKESDVEVISVYLEGNTLFHVFCNQEMSRRNWKQIVEWDKYRYGNSPDASLRDFGSGIDSQPGEEMHHNQTIYSELVPDGGEPDGETAGRVE